MIVSKSTPTELQGKITNNNLTLVIPGGRAARTNRFMTATGAKLFVGSIEDTNSICVSAALQWVAGYLNANGDQKKIDAANEAYKKASAKKNFVINPTNAEFPQ